jgi:menaquinone-dependent protoporphyrinogen oxidase
LPLSINVGRESIDGAMVCPLVVEHTGPKVLGWDSRWPLPWRPPDAQAAGMRILVVYGSKMGGTAGLAEMIGEALRRDGVPARVRPADTVDSVGGYDAVIVGGALYHGRWHRAASRFVRRHRADLRSMPVWFFSSGPLGDDEQNPHIPPVRQVRRLMRGVGVRGHATFGGRLLANPPALAAGFQPDPWLGDWRNPDEVARWVAGIVIQMTTSNPRVASPLA